MANQAAVDASPRVALADIETLSRPAELAAAVEITIASPAVRAFPTRVSGSLGLCLKVGAAHALQADGQTREYPADAICVRPPGCVWSTANTGVAGFICVDIAAANLPSNYRSGRMEFARAVELDVRALAALLSSAAPRLQKDEKISEVIDWSARAGIILSPELHQHQAGALPLERARAFLETSMASNPSLDEVAQAAGMNKHVLIRTFRKRFGATPHAYLLMSRIEHARTLLCRGCSVAEVALCLGFADQAHFARVFRRLVGLPPATYRRRARHSG
jgi:AraC-like DNA-binding protein